MALLLKTKRITIMIGRFLMIPSGSLVEKVLLTIITVKWAIIRLQWTVKRVMCVSSISSHGHPRFQGFK